MHLFHKYGTWKYMSGSALSMLALMLMVTTSVIAQTGTAALRGSVMDKQGKAISGARVVLTSTEKNFSRVLVTNDEGGYVFTSIAPGTYRIEVEATNFKKASLNDVVAQVDANRNIEIILEIGSVSETTTVTAASEAPINTTDASIGHNFESRRIENLPLNARNIVGLLSL